MISSGGSYHYYEMGLGMFAKLTALREGIAPAGAARANTDGGDVEASPIRVGPRQIDTVR
jgi:hypothetical protein